MATRLTPQTVAQDEVQLMMILKKNLILGARVAGVSKDVPG